MEPPKRLDPSGYLVDQAYEDAKAEDPPEEIVHRETLPVSVRCLVALSQSLREDFGDDLRMRQEGEQLLFYRPL